MNWETDRGEWVGGCTCPCMIREREKREGWVDQEEFDF